MDLFCMCELTAQGLNMTSKSDGICYQQKIWKTVSNWVIAVIMGNSGNNSLCFV